MVQTGGNTHLEEQFYKFWPKHSENLAILVQEHQNLVSRPKSKKPTDFGPGVKI